MLAVECNNLTVVRRLLESDSPPVNLSCQDNNCRTVLHHAAYAPKWGYWENTEMLKILIEGGALLNDEGKNYHLVVYIRTKRRLYRKSFISQITNKI